MEYVSQVGIVYGVSLRACVARIWLYGAGAPGPDPQGTETSNSAVRVVNEGSGTCFFLFISVGETKTLQKLHSKQAPKQRVRAQLTREM